MNKIDIQEIFSESEINQVSIYESARRMSVSSATIRNWLKTGYLKAAGRGLVDELSLHHFQEHVAGKSKLNKRANKSLKDNHNHSKIALEFINRIKLDKVNGCQLGSEYENSLSDAYRNKEGVYFTPLSVVRDLLTFKKRDYNSLTFCDPCCGSGNFIIHALALGFKPENVYGFDVDPVAIEITKARIKEYCGYESKNIQEADFFQIATEINHPQFNVIYTNPPWGKKLTKETKNFLGKKLNAGSSLDTSSLFFFACLKCLVEDGELGLLLPEAFFNISTFEYARVKALDLSIERLIDYGKAFKGLVTKAQGVVLSNKPVEASNMVSCEAKDIKARRSIESFTCNPKSILNFYCDEESAATLRYLFSIPHITLAGNASWGLGIVTGNNSKFIANSQKDGYIPVYKGSDISELNIKKPSCFIPSDLGLYQQVAPLHIFMANEKLIYKFISSRLCFFHDTEQRYLLNSANMLIPQKNFPVSIKILGELLNSDFVNWMFASLFNTHKILRGDLESLPIYSQFLNGISKFDEGEYLDKLNIERKKNGTYRVKK